MASGQQHFIHGILTAIPVTAIGMTVGIPTSTIILANAVGILLSPDIDMESKTFTEQTTANLLSKFFHRRKNKQQKIARFFGAILQTITAPYAYFIPHRSWISHLPPFSVISQGLYFYALYWVIYTLCGWSILPLSFFLYHPQFVNYFCIIAFHHFIHLLADGGMILLFGKNRYLLGKPFYHLTTKIFPQGD